MVKNTNTEVIEPSNSTTMFRNINSDQLQIRGKILQWSFEKLKTKSSNLILLNNPEDAKFSGEKHE